MYGSPPDNFLELSHMQYTVEIAESVWLIHGPKRPYSTTGSLFLWPKVI